MKQYGDITKLNGEELAPVDLIVGGSPCQDLSVAGKRAGLEGERSGLFMEMIRIVKEMRNATNFIRPRYLLWENVCGAFSSGQPKGADFQAVLAEIVSIVEPEAPDVPIPSKGWSKAGVLMGDGWSIAWRTHDAQFWGVPQRRRRIALVADFRGQSAPEILFERTSLSGDPDQSAAEREGPAGTAENSIGETSLCLNDQGGSQMSVTDGVTNTLRSQMKHHEPIVMNPRPMSMVTQTDKAATLGADDYKEPQIVLSFQERAGKPGGGQRNLGTGRPCRSVEHDE